METKKGLITIHFVDQSKVYFEFPLSLMEREMMFGSAVAEISNNMHSVLGYKSKTPRHVLFSKTDKKVNLCLVNSLYTAEDENLKAALDSPSFGMGYVYYSSASNPKNLLYVKRSFSGLSDTSVYGSFGDDIVGLDQGIIGRTAKNIGLATKDGMLRILNLYYDMNTYTKPSDNEKNSLQYLWKIDGDILFLDFRYGNMALY